MNKKYFLISPANAADMAQLKAIFGSKVFYPDIMSVPPLPATYDPTFDYRQFFIIMGFDNNGNAIVFTRSEYTVSQFNTNVIATADWTNRYYFTVAPTVTALPNFTENTPNGQSGKTNIGAFLSYDYQLYNNR